MFDLEWKQNLNQMYADVQMKLDTTDLKLRENVVDSEMKSSSQLRQTMLEMKNFDELNREICGLYCYEAQMIEMHCVIFKGKTAEVILLEKKRNSVRFDKLSKNYFKTKTSVDPNIDKLIKKLKNTSEEIFKKNQQILEEQEKISQILAVQKPNQESKLRPREARIIQLLDDINELFDLMKNFISEIKKLHKIVLSFHDSVNESVK